MMYANHRATDVACWREMESPGVIAEIVALLRAADVAKVEGRGDDRALLNERAAALARDL